MQSEQLSTFLACIAGQTDRQVVTLSNYDLGSLTTAEFETLGVALGRCTQLQTLQLFFNDFGTLKTAEFEALGMALGQCTQLQTLYLSSQSLHHLNAEGFEGLGVALGRCSQLETLDLSGSNLNRLKAGQFEALGVALGRCSQLQTLCLSGLHLLNTAGFEAFGVALGRCSQLQTLNLFGNNLCNLKAAQFEALGMALGRCSQLQTLDLRGNYLGCLEATEFAALCGALGRCSQLRTLALSVPSTLKAAELEPLGILRCTQLQTLDLNATYFHNLGAAELGVLGRALEQCSQLHTLSLSLCCLGDHAAGFEGFCQVLGQCTRLQTLDLSGNNLDRLKAAQFEAFGVALGRCTRLQTLRLCINTLGVLDVAEFEAFGRALERCTRLQTLDLSHNDLGRSGYSRLSVATVTALCRALQCSQIQKLNLSSNYLQYLDADVLAALINGLSQCKNLLQITVNDCPPVQSAQLRSICEKNHQELINQIIVASEQMQPQTNTPYLILSDDVRLMILSNAFNTVPSSVLEKVDRGVKNIFTTKRGMNPSTLSSDTRVMTPSNISTHAVASALNTEDEEQVEKRTRSRYKL